MRSVLQHIFSLLILTAFIAGSFSGCGQRKGQGLVDQPAPNEVSKEEASGDYSNDGYASDESSSGDYDQSPTDVQDGINAGGTDDYGQGDADYSGADDLVSNDPSLPTETILNDDLPVENDPDALGAADEDAGILNPTDGLLAAVTVPEADSDGPAAEPATTEPSVLGGLAGIPGLGTAPLPGESLLGEETPQDPAAPEATPNAQIDQLMQSATAAGGNADGGGLAMLQALIPFIVQVGAQ